MLHEPGFPIVGLSRDRQVRHPVALGVIQQIFKLLQDLVGLRVRYPTVHLNIRNTLFYRPAQQFPRFRGKVFTIHGQSGSTMPSKASTTSSYSSLSGIGIALGPGFAGVADGLRGGHWRISRARRACLVLCSDSRSKSCISSTAWKIRTSSTWA